MGRRVFVRPHPSRHGWWNPTQLAELFGTDRKTARRWLAEGTLKVSCYKDPTGKRRLVQHKVLMRFLRSDPQYKALIARADPPDD